MLTDTADPTDTVALPVYAAPHPVAAVRAAASTVTLPAARVATGSLGLTGTGVRQGDTDADPDAASTYFSSVSAFEPAGHEPGAAVVRRHRHLALHRLRRGARRRPRVRRGRQRGPYVAEPFEPESSADFGLGYIGVATRGRLAHADLRDVHRLVRHAGRRRARPGAAQRPGARHRRHGRRAAARGRRRAGRGGRRARCRRRAAVRRRRRPHLGQRAVPQRRDGAAVRAARDGAGPAARCRRRAADLDARALLGRELDGDQRRAGRRGRPRPPDVVRPALARRRCRGADDRRRVPGRRVRRRDVDAAGAARRGERCGRPLGRRRRGRPRLQAAAAAPPEPDRCRCRHPRYVRGGGLRVERHGRRADRLGGDGAVGCGHDAHRDDDARRRGRHRPLPGRRPARRVEGGAVERDVGRRHRAGARSGAGRRQPRADRPGWCRPRPRRRAGTPPRRSRARSRSRCSRRSPRR
nr:hypothetical protein [Angustibacter aerolatus]